MDNSDQLKCSDCGHEFVAEDGPLKLDGGRLPRLCPECHYVVRCEGQGQVVLPATAFCAYEDLAIGITDVGPVYPAAGEAN